MVFQAQHTTIDDEGRQAGDAKRPGLGGGPGLPREIE
jgi:hypothetical protein